MNQEIEEMGLDSDSARLLLKSVRGSRFICWIPAGTSQLGIRQPKLSRVMRLTRLSENISQCSTRQRTAPPVSLNENLSLQYQMYIQRRDGASVRTANGSGPM